MSKNAQPKKQTKKEIEKESKRLRALVSQSIFPLLVKEAKSVKEAKDICKTLVVGMDALFAKKMREYQEVVQEEPLSGLNMQEFMKDRKQYKTEWALVELLANEKVSVAKMLIEGMGKEIERLVEKELTERSVETLKTEWLE